MRVTIFLLSLAVATGAANAAGLISIATDDAAVKACVDLQVKNGKTIRTAVQQCLAKK